MDILRVLVDCSRDRAQLAVLVVGANPNDLLHFKPRCVRYARRVLLLLLHIGENLPRAVRAVLRSFLSGPNRFFLSFKLIDSIDSKIKYCQRDRRNYQEL